MTKFSFVGELVNVCSFYLNLFKVYSRYSKVARTGKINWKESRINKNRQKKLFNEKVKTEIQMKCHMSSQLAPCSLLKKRSSLKR